MKNLPIRSVVQFEQFLKGTSEQGIEVEITSKKDAYEFIKTVLVRCRYNTLEKKEKQIVLRYLKYTTKYSKTHLKRCVQKWRKGLLYFNPKKKRNRFSVKYFADDVALLIKTDIVHGTLSAEATKRILEREYSVYGKIEYGNIRNISPSYIYKLRKSNRQYTSSKALTYTRTKAVSAKIGVRRKPEPMGKPGYVRVDTVHQGDLELKKGVYHINIVDEVTQWEIVMSVEKISEHYLRPVIEELLTCFPFQVVEFHSDNGSEYINKVVAQLLNKLHIELTKSRSRHSNDNALVESKNGSIVRKWYGRNYIDAKWAERMSQWSKSYLNPYLSFHRPCGFAKDIVDKRGKVKKKYDTWMTPYEKLKSIPEWETYLKEGFSPEYLEELSKKESDNESAEKMMKAKEKLFREIRGK